MKEAVEIAKLRLFLKLVATVDVNPRKENYGLEPLPDIDFNIRAGNTLIGFATEKELLRAVQVDQHGQYRTGYEEVFEKFKEDCELVSKAYNHFQNAQLINDQGSDSFNAAKTELNKRLNKLNHKLNEYLATNYGITDAGGKQKEKFQEWLITHQPFHWFAEFYQIVTGNGGFDCIIGNPPYVVYNRKNKQTKKSVQDEYNIQNYLTLSTNNLYAFVIERTYSLINNNNVGMIIPLTSVANNNMHDLRILLSNKGNQYYSHFEIRPSKLFDGVDQRLTIFITRKSSNNNIQSTKINRWNSEQRVELFNSLTYSNSFLKSRIWRLSKPIENNIYKIFQTKKPITQYLSKQKNHKNMIHYRTAGARYWIIFTNNGFGSESLSNKSSSFLSELDSKFFTSVLNSNLYWWYYAINFDMFNIKDYMIFSFRCDYLKSDKLVNLSSQLENDFDLNKEKLVTESVTRGTIESFVYRKKKSKPIIDQIDTVLAQHYGFTEEELDFIINYDIKYRMGKELYNGEDKE